MQKLREVKIMEIGLIGLGKMGGNMVKRLVPGGHQVVAFDLNEENVKQAEKDGAKSAESLQDLVSQLKPPRNVWVMVPHGKATEETINKLLGLLEKNDLIIDGGNSNYIHSMEIAKKCKEKSIHFMDVGVSGGVWGLKVGYNLMIGGSQEAYQRMEPVYQRLAPENGYALVGKNGAGHFVKMIHNALEYAMLEAVGESFECLERSDFEIDLKKVADLWQHGAVVRSWLLELLSGAFESEGNNLARISDYIDDSGMGRWTVKFATENAIPIPAITMALYERFASRLEQRFSAKVVAALRNQFGGHAIKESKQ
jgi:6-phosphogluconate dehydrogenase